MQIVSSGDNLHKNQILLSGKNKKKKKIVNLSSADFAHRVEEVKQSVYVGTRRCQMHDPESALLLKTCYNTLE